MGPRNEHAGVPAAAVAAGLEDGSVPTLGWSTVDVTGDRGWIHRGDVTRR